MTTKKTTKSPKVTEITTEKPELGTELSTEGGDELDQTGTELVTELGAGGGETDTENTELTAFISQSQAKPECEGTSTAAEIEKITAAAARVMVANGMSGLLGAVSQLTKTDMMLSKPEIDSFAKDIAPLIVKYGNNIDDLPPWLKALLKHKVELVAAKGIIMLSVSLYSKYKTEREKIELQKQQLEEAKKAEAANQEQAQEAA